jgi:hypothetical protein
MVSRADANQLRSACRRRNQQVRQTRTNHRPRRHDCSTAAHGGAVLALGREFGHERLQAAVASTVSHGACDVAAVRYLLTEASLHKPRPAPIDVGALASYDRPLPDLGDYDTLLSGPCAGTA